MHVKIESDGTDRGTKVMNSDGKPIDGVAEVSWSCRVNDIAHATIELVIVDVSTNAVAKFIGPNGKEISRIVYADGSEDLYE